MNRHDLKLNKHKTEVVRICTKFHDGLSMDYVNIGNERIPLCDKAIGLGVVLIKHISFDHHIKHLCKSLVYQFRNFFYQDQKVSWQRISCPSCNPLAARFVSGARKFDSISPILVKLHWLPISYRVVFKLLLLVFKAVNGLGPRYFFEFLQYQNDYHSRTLRPNSLELLLQQNPLDYGTIFL